MLWKQVEAQTGMVNNHEAAIQQMQPASPSTTPHTCHACGPGVSGAMGVPAEDGSTTPNTPGGDGVMASTMLKITGGNGQCHCVHVTELQQKVEAIEKDLNTLKTTPLRADAPAFGGADPFVQLDLWNGQRPTGHV